MEHAIWEFFQCFCVGWFIGGVIIVIIKYLKGG